MDDDTGLGKHWWLMIVLLSIGGIVAATLVLIVFTKAWYAWGLLGTFLALAGVLLLFGWAFDRRDRRRRERLAA